VPWLAYGLFFCSLCYVFPHLLSYIVYTFWYARNILYFELLAPLIQWKYVGILSPLPLSELKVAPK
jgi:hypothetical protein